MLSHHTLPKTSGKKKTRVGRGNASSGNYSGRGMKGQRARSGGKGGLKLRGLKQSFLAIPKKRGFTSPHARPQVVNLAQLDTTFDDGATVTVAALIEKGLIEDTGAPVKILSTGKLSKKLTVQAHGASKKAIEAIQAAGGAFEAVSKKKTAPVKSGNTQAAK